MTHGTEHHLHEADHAHHHAHDPFDRRVAMTMAILAAVLAGVTMFSHRAHNQTLHLQNESLAFQAEVNKLETEADTLHTRANTLHTQASDQWSYYQAKKNRLYQYEAFADLVGVLPRDGNRPAAAGPGGEGAAADPRAGGEAEKLAQNWKSKVKKYQQESDDIQRKAEGLEKEAEDFKQKAQQKLDEIQDLQQKAEHKKAESIEVHHRADRLDYGHLGLELALVVCSVAVLTKQRSFWYTGLGVGAIGVLVALSTLLMH